MVMLKPQFEEGWRNLEGSMSDRGIPIGADIWNNESNRFYTARDSAQMGAARQADLDASNEFQRQYGNQLTEYNLPLQQLSALMGNSSAVQNPSFAPFAQSSAAGTDVAGNIWNKYQADVNAANQKNSQLWNGLLGIGQLGLSMGTGGMSSMLGQAFLPQLGPGNNAFG